MAANMFPCCSCPGPVQCGGIDYLGGCGLAECCNRRTCCPPRRRRVMEKLPRCYPCPPPGFPNPPLGCCAPCPCCSSGFPPCPCEPHPCYPLSCRRPYKCAEWPCCPCGRPCYRPVGPPKLCYRPKCCPLCPDCPLPKAAPLPCWPRLFAGCKYCPPIPCSPCYLEGPPKIVRDTFCCPNKCSLASL